MKAVTVAGCRSVYDAVDITDISSFVNQESTYNGDERVVLPEGYLGSIDAAVDMHAEQIDAVAVNLDVAALELSFFQRLLRRGALALAIWLIPVVWAIFD